MPNINLPFLAVQNSSIGDLVPWSDIVRTSIIEHLQGMILETIKSDIGQHLQFLLKLLSQKQTTPGKTNLEQIEVDQENCTLSADAFSHMAN